MTKADLEDLCCRVFPIILSLDLSNVVDSFLAFWAICPDPPSDRLSNVFDLISIAATIRPASTLPLVRFTSLLLNSLPPDATPPKIDIPLFDLLLRPCDRPLESFRTDPTAPVDARSALWLDDARYLDSSWRRGLTIEVRLGAETVAVPDLFAAAFFGASECFRLLVGKTATGIRRRSAGWTIADAAVAGGSVEIVRMLDDRKVPLTGFGLCEKAIRYHREKVFRWLHTRAPPDEKGIDQCLALCRKYGALQIERELLAGRSGKTAALDDLLSGY
jgi:hypothetical protein